MARVYVAAAVKRKIAVGLKQLDEGRALDGQAVFERAVARLRGSRRKAG